MFEEVKVEIPSYQQLMRPVLEAAVKGPRKISDVVEEISDQLGLSDKSRQQMLPSGKQTVIANRVHWARSYLKQAGLVNNVKRGWYEITARGLAALNQHSLTINTKFLEQFDEFQEFRQRSRDDSSESSEEIESISDDTITPDEQIDIAFKRLNSTLSATILEATRNADPDFFEQIMIDVLIAMGYGGSSTLAGRRLGRTGDNGVDGVIDQDLLGVDQIYFQAKRYKKENTISYGDMRDFFGALNLKNASKGIFVTTSSFSASAKETAEKLNTRIVLIDGPKLANLMVRFGVGCKEKDTLRIMEFEESYFEE